MTQPIETLLFDFGGTLDADGISWQARFYAHYRAEGLEMPAAAFAPLFYAADDALIGALAEECELGETAERLAGNLEGELARSCGRGGKAGADRARGRRVAASFLAEAQAALARNRPHLAVLGKRYRMGIVSNFYGNLEAVCRGAGLAGLFEVIVDSHRVGAKKPDPAIFRAALDPLGARPATTLMIGDSLTRDREGARRMGIGFVWIAPGSARASKPRAGAAELGQSRVAQLPDLAEVLHDRQVRPAAPQGRHHRRRRG
ncbi:MAG TPA: HAD family hydrolase [Alphaproteobacteria bacterium]|nr:HAD family hydrolase [Alphaproteobacteria bacterium]